MTGAPLPAGADAVVMVEQTTETGDNRVRIDAAVRSGQNIMRRGASFARGQTVLEAGKLLRGIELGLLAEVGCQEVTVIPQPQLWIIATGNELVDFWEVPGPGQIRNSNSLLLWGLARQAGAVASMKDIARDDADDLRAKISQVVHSDIIVLSGGVSAGTFDLVPKILADLGVEQVFHKVNVKPGKPVWFGVKEHANERRTLVFGLPGNPVSTLVCFELFVRPAIQKLCGRPPLGLPRAKGALTQDHQQRGARPTYWPAALETEGDRQRVRPLPWKGSGDLRTLTDANCLACFPPGDRTFAAGEEIEVRLLPQPHAEMAGAGR
jgi:molybdopterin molybdotransferase